LLWGTLAFASPQAIFLGGRGARPPRPSYNRRPWHALHATCIFVARKENLNEYRPTLLAAEMSTHDMDACYTRQNDSCTARCPCDSSAFLFQCWQRFFCYCLWLRRTAVSARWRCASLSAICRVSTTATTFRGKSWSPSTYLSSTCRSPMTRQYRLGGDLTIVSRRNRTCSASDSAYSYTFLRSVVCLSVVCHIRAPCLNSSTDLDAIWQVRLWGQMTHCVRWGSLTSRGIWNLGVKPPTKTCNCKLQPNRQPYAATCRIQTKSCHCDSVFCQLALVLDFLIFSRHSWKYVH